MRRRHVRLITQANFCASEDIDANLATRSLRWPFSFASLRAPPSPPPLVNDPRPPSTISHFFSFFIFLLISPIPISLVYSNAYSLLVRTSLLFLCSIFSPALLPSVVFRPSSYFSSTLSARCSAPSRFQLFGPFFIPRSPCPSPRYKFIYFVRTAFPHSI